jgi:S-formylglutathione hydrolase FrmB
MKKFILLSIISLIFLSGCRKLISEGEKPKSIQKEIPYKSGSTFFKEENLEVKYITVENFLKKDSNDIIFYLHGLNRTEFEWVEENGFGKNFYEVVKENPDIKSFTVVSISMGGVYLFIDGAPYPYSAVLESFFLNKIIPFFKQKYSKTGNVYLIGHSLGGFNALMVSLRHPDKVKAVSLISPYVAPISPFTKSFDEKGKELRMPLFQVMLLKFLLTNAFKNERKWEEYNPFKLIEKENNFPYISLSDSRNDLPGFEWSIDNFAGELERRGIEHSFCKSDGDHWSVCKKNFYNFLKKIS